MFVARCKGRLGASLLAFIAFATSLALSAAEPRPPALTGKPWADMDYGPFKTHSLQVYPGNIANKGIAIRVDPGQGGIAQGSEFLLFETDTLRMAGGWTGRGFNNWRNIMHNGEHGVHAAIVGNTLFSNPDAPGWAGPSGDFSETRLEGRDQRRYGPMDEAVGRWKGLYLHGQQVVLSYEVGGTQVLELPTAEGPETNRVFSRILNLGPRSHDLIIQVAHQATVLPELRPLGRSRGASGMFAVFPTSVDQPRSHSGTRDPWIILDGRTRLLVDGSNAFDMTRSDFTWFARIRTEEDGSIVSKTAVDSFWTIFGKTFFVRDGRLGYDIGWVGVVSGKTKVNDGEWHRVAVTYQAKTGAIQLYVDGQPDGEGILRIPEETDDTETRAALENMNHHQVQFGFTSPDFPVKHNESHFSGNLGDVRFYNQALSSDELRTLGRRSEYEDPRIVGRWSFREIDPERQTAKDDSEQGHFASIRKSDSDAAAAGVTVAAVVGELPGLKWVTTETGHLRLSIPAGANPARIKLLLTKVAGAENTTGFESLALNSAPPIDLEPLTQGGPARWQETLTTKSSIHGNDDGPFIVERITVPFDNPYRSMMRLGGFDFFKDGRRAAVCTAMGDVWIVDGLGGTFDTFTWKRIGTGMYEPLGLKIVNDQVYVTCRDQITRLHDLNGDDETDYYEAFNHDHMASEHYHEFAMCLETDAAGNFYYLKAAGHAMNARFPHHGTLIKVTRDGRQSEVIANGFRAPNGLWVSPDGSHFLTTDQEGHWTPKNRINWVVPGGFYGYMMGYHEGRDEDEFVPPITWVHNKYDNSPSEAFMVETDGWGPLNGKMAYISYGRGKIYHVMQEKTKTGLHQGGITELDLKNMPTGLSRSRFHPGDGQLYACGLFVWCSDVTQIGGFYRIKYTGQPLYMPTELHVSTDGVVISFTDALDRNFAEDPGNYSAEMWNYLRRQNYGSADFKVADQGEGHTTLDLKSVSVSRDGKSIFLEMPQIQKVMQAHVDLNLKASDGKRIRKYVHFTVHELGDRSGKELLNQR